MYVWRLDLDSSHNPRSDNLLVKKIDDTAFNNASIVVGVKQKMLGDHIHLLLWRTDKKLYYMDFDFTVSSVTASLL